jgi:hypothetical protein
MLPFDGGASWCLACALIAATLFSLDDSGDEVADGDGQGERQTLVARAAAVALPLQQLEAVVVHALGVHAHQLVQLRQFRFLRRHQHDMPTSESLSPPRAP